MRQYFFPSIYRTHDVQTLVPDPDAVDKLMRGVNECTEHIQRQPYDPVTWTKRASYLLALNYPELAVGDAYKAQLLFDRASNGSQDVWDTKKPSSGENRIELKSYDILGQALYDCHCHLEAAEFWEDVSNKTLNHYGADKAVALRALLERKREAGAAMGGTAQEQEDRIRDGGVFTVHYPWMHKCWLARNREIIASINEELDYNVQPRACYLGQSTLSAEEDVLGAFAARDIQEGECILVDRTATGARSSSNKDRACGNCYTHVIDEPIQAQCCSEVYCSTECHFLSRETYHAALCGQDFDWLQRPAKGLQDNASPIRPLLMLRFLAACLQAGAHNSPLDHPLIARLQPLANKNHVDVFTIHESVIAPIKILQQLGVDIFANPNFDTMILRAVWTRIANNKAGSRDGSNGFVDSITPLLPLFNHSCERNVTYKRDSGSTTTRFFANRNIAKGEELFDSYLNVEGMFLEARTERL